METIIAVIKRNDSKYYTIYHTDLWIDDKCEADTFDIETARRLALRFNSSIENYTYTAEVCNNDKQV